MSRPDMQKISAIPTVVCAFLGACAVEPRTWSDEWPIPRDEQLVVALFLPPDRPLSPFVEDAAHDPRVLARLSDDVLAVRTTAEAHPDAFRAATGYPTGLAIAVFDSRSRPIAAHVGYADGDTFVTLIERARQHAPELARLRALPARTNQENFELARLLGLSGLPHRAREILTRDGTEFDDSPAATRSLALLARLDAEQGDNVLAKQWLSRAEKATRDADVAAHCAFTAAHVASIERRMRDAATTIEAALTTHPDYEERDSMQLFRAICLHEAGDDPAAVQALQDLLRTSSNQKVRVQILETIQHIQSADHGHTH